MKTLPPVAATLTRAHAALLDDLRKLEEAVAPQSQADVDDVVTRLTLTLTHVMEHFRLKQHDGYMTEVKDLEPRWETPVQDLREEHRALRHELQVLFSEATAATRLDDTFQAKVRAWIERVHQHQGRENRLVQEAFEVEIGGEA